MSYKPEDYAHLTPCLVVRDGAKAIDFYKRAFGFEVPDEVAKDEHGKVQYASLRLRDSTIMIFPEGAFGSPNKAPATTKSPSPISLYIYVPNVDDFYQKAIKGGAQTVEAPNDAFWGDRFCKVSDPDGYVWAFATFNEEKHALHKQEKKK